MNFKQCNLFQIFQNALLDIFEKGNETHDASQAASIDILFLNKIVFKSCSIIPTSTNKYESWGDASLLF